MIISNTVIGKKHKANADVFEAYLGSWSVLLFQKDSNCINDEHELFTFDENWLALVSLMTELIGKSPHGSKIQTNFSVDNKKRKKRTTKLKQDKFIGYSTVRFAVSLALFEKAYFCKEGRLTQLREIIYTSVEYKKLMKTSHNDISNVTIDPENPQLYQVGKYVREANDSKEVFKRCLVIRSAVDKTFFLDS